MVHVQAVSLNLRDSHIHNAHSFLKSQLPGTGLVELTRLSYLVLNINLKEEIVEFSLGEVET